MFLSVVILGRFTTETHAMALYIGTDTPHTHLHHVTGRNLLSAPGSLLATDVIAAPDSFFDHRVPSLTEHWRRIGLDLDLSLIHI